MPPYRGELKRAATLLRMVQKTSDRKAREFWLRQAKTIISETAREVTLPVMNDSQWIDITEQLHLVERRMERLEREAWPAV